MPGRPRAAASARARRAPFGTSIDRCLAARAGCAAGGMNAQCASYAAPSAIHCRNVATSCGGKIAPVSTSAAACARPGRGSRCARTDRSRLACPGRSGRDPVACFDALLADVEPQPGVPLFGSGPWQMKAFVRKDRPDVAVKAHLVPGTISTTDDGQQGRSSQKRGGQY